MKVGKWYGWQIRALILEVLVWIACLKYIFTGILW